MKRKRHNPELIIRQLRTAEQLLNQGQSVDDVRRALEVSDPTYQRWQQLCDGMNATEAKRLKELELENTRLIDYSQTPNWTRRCLRSLPRVTSKPGASSQGRGLECFV